LTGGKDTIIIIYFLSAFAFFSLRYDFEKTKISSNVRRFVLIGHFIKVVEYMDFSHILNQWIYLFLND